MELLKYVMYQTEAALPYEESKDSVSSVLGCYLAALVDVRSSWTPVASLKTNGRYKMLDEPLAC